MLSPGICPYSNNLTQANYYEIQKFIKNYFTDKTVLTTLVKNEGEEHLIPRTFGKSDGVDILSGEKDEVWMYFEELSDQSYEIFILDIQ